MSNYAKKLSPILQEIEMLLLENYETKPEFDKESFRAITCMFQSAIMDKMFSLQENENQLEFLTCQEAPL